MLLSKFFDEHFAKIYLAMCKRSTVDLYRQILNLRIDKIGNSGISPADCQQFVSLALVDVVHVDDGTAKLVFHLPWCHGMMTDLAKPLNVSRQNADRAVKELIKAGFVKQQRRYLRCRSRFFVPRVMIHLLVFR